MNNEMLVSFHYQAIYTTCKLFCFVLLCPYELQLKFRHLENFKKRSVDEA